MGKRELIALLNLSSWCLVTVERLFLAVPRGCLQFVIVVFPDHTHLLFITFTNLRHHIKFIKMHPIHYYHSSCRCYINIVFHITMVMYRFLISASLLTFIFYLIIFFTDTKIKRIKVQIHFFSLNSFFIHNFKISQSIFYIFVDKYHYAS